MIASFVLKALDRNIVVVAALLFAVAALVPAAAGTPRECECEDGRHGDDAGGLPGSAAHVHA